MHQERVEQGGGIEPDDVIVSTAPSTSGVDGGAVVVNSSGAVVSMAPAPTVARKSNGQAIVVTAGPPSVGGVVSQDLSTSTTTRWSEEDDHPEHHQPSTAQALLSGITEPVPVSTGQLIVPTTSTNAARENDLISTTAAAAAAPPPGAFTSSAGGGIVTSAGPIDLKDIGAHHADVSAFMPDVPDVGGHMPALLEQQLVGSSQPVALVGSSKATGSAAPTNDEGEEARLTVVEAADDSSQDPAAGLPLLTNSTQKP